LPRSLLTIHAVYESLPHPADFHLAQMCLERNDAALRRLQDLYAASVANFLVGVGASPEEAHEITDSLWGHCLAPDAEGQSRLARYCGAASLQTWLNTVALNRLVSAKRREDSWQRLAPERIPAVSEIPDGDPEPAWMADSRSAGTVEAPLLHLMREAIEAAFMACPAEDFVLLQLAHTDNLRVVELAKMFDCGIATISRNVVKAGDGIAEATLQYVKASDPWLDLKWEDFLDLCGSASPAFFGVE
jgi:DNA-directed RNA polymerase specialized sigma24 family protein